MSKYSLYYYKMQVFFHGHSYAALKGRHRNAHAFCESVCANKLLAEEHVEAAERAAKLYIKALDEIHN